MAVERYSRRLERRRLDNLEKKGVPVREAMRVLRKLSIPLHKQAKLEPDRKVADKLMKLAYMLRNKQTAAHLLTIQSADDSVPISKTLGSIFGEKEAESVIKVLANGQGETLPTGGPILQEGRKMYMTSTPGVVIVDTIFKSRFIPRTVEIIAASPAGTEALRLPPTSRRQ